MSACVCAVERYFWNEQIAWECLEKAFPRRVIPGLEENRNIFNWNLLCIHIEHQSSLIHIYRITESWSANKCGVNCVGFPEIRTWKRKIEIKSWKPFRTKRSNMKIISKKTLYLPRKKENNEKNISNFSHLKCIKLFCLILISPSKKNV